MTDTTDQPRLGEEQDDDRHWRRHGARYRARRRAVDILFEAEARDIDPVAIVEDRVELARLDSNGVAPIASYTRDIIAGAAEQLDTIDETIERYLAEDWELNRLPAVDRAILRVGVWEILYNPDVDGATSVVEGVELASQYGSDVAAPYIHAVLDDVVQAGSELNPFGEPVVDADADPEFTPDEPGVDAEPRPSSAADPGPGPTRSPDSPDV